ncbi:MFS transporter [Paenarthrobacter sp. Z7-10]|uniref:MFS transporter n=1 Tax=Paenarthrobacter sp. Z7-10 TaxID=2787635 RepID=UPI0022A99EC3|nr:MFS transporter [Paenarthrobacter sp. Z7-10]MCZ2403289.1 MFS transporter [Paenarthrobacter sp. Z7-10]
MGHNKGSRAYRRILLALGCAGIATFAQLYSVQGLLPLLARNLDISAAQAGLTISAATIGLALTVLPWSFAADRFGRVRTMATAIIAATVLGLLVPLSPNFPVLLGMRTLEGMALGGIPALAIAYLNEEINKVHAAMAAGAYVAGTTLGGLFGRLLAGPVADLAGWRVATASVSACAAVAAIGFLLLAPPPRGLVAAHGTGVRSRLAGLVPLLRNRRLLALYAQGFLLMGSFVSVYNYLGFRLEAPPYLLPVSAVALIFLAYLAGTVSSRWAASLSARAGRRNVLLGSIVLMTGGLAVTLCAPLVLILAGLVLFTAGFFGAHSIASGWTGSVVSTGRAQAASLYNLGYYAGSSVLGWASGFVFQAGGWLALVIALAVLAVLASATALILLPAGRPLPVRRPDPLPAT